MHTCIMNQFTKHKLIQRKYCWCLASLCFFESQFQWSSFLKCEMKAVIGQNLDSNSSCNGRIEQHALADLTETPYGNLENCFQYFRDLVLCHAVRVSSLAIILWLLTVALFSSRILSRVIMWN